MTQNEKLMGEDAEKEIKLWRLQRRKDLLRRAAGEERKKEGKGREMSSANNSMSSANNSDSISIFAPLAEELGLFLHSPEESAFVREAFGYADEICGPRGEQPGQGKSGESTQLSESSTASSGASSSTIIRKSSKAAISNSMNYSAAEKMRGLESLKPRALIYVGEGNGGVNADADFFKLLMRHFFLYKVVDDLELLPDRFDRAYFKLTYLLKSRILSVL